MINLIKSVSLKKLAWHKNNMKLNNKWWTEKNICFKMLIILIYSSFLQTERKQNYNDRNTPKYMSRRSQKKKWKWHLNVHKDAQTCSYSGKCKWKPQRATNLHISDCQASKNLTTYSAGKLFQEIAEENTAPSKRNLTIF